MKFLEGDTAVVAIGVAVRLPDVDAVHEARGWVGEPCVAQVESRAEDGVPLFGSEMCSALFDVGKGSESDEEWMRAGEHARETLIRLSVFLLDVVSDSTAQLGIRWSGAHHERHEDILEDVIRREHLRRGVSQVPLRTSGLSISAYLLHALPSFGVSRVIHGKPLHLADSFGRRNERPVVLAPFPLHVVAYCGVNKVSSPSRCMYTAMVQRLHEI